jgi:predicted house-cleaning noncanonical NTP pyrophosphatase (MazG superfamily)
MPTYNKLIRDKIPEIIEKTDKKFRTRLLDNNEYQKELKIKLKEELEEYIEAQSDEAAIEELADLLEVIKSLSEIHNSSFSEVERVRQQKEEVRGGFHERIFLIDVED